MSGPPPRQPSSGPIATTRLSRRYGVPAPVVDLWHPRPGDRFALRRWPLASVRVHGLERRDPMLGGRWERTMTLVNDLHELDRDVARWKSNLRNEVNRASARDGLRFVDDWSLARFQQFHRDSDADNPAPPVPGQLEALCAAGHVRLHAALLDDRPLCAHAYLLVRGERVVLMHSYSARRNLGTPAEAALAGRANRALHVDAMRRYRAQGFRWYDWGGFSGNPGYGPDAFKRQFGGTLEEVWQLRRLAWPGRATLRF